MSGRPDLHVALFAGHDGGRRPLDAAAGEAALRQGGEDSELFVLAPPSIARSRWPLSLLSPPPPLPPPTKKKHDRQLSRVHVREGTSSEDSGWGDGCSDPSQWILWGRDWSDRDGGGPPAGICKPRAAASSSASSASASSSASAGSKGEEDCASTIGLPKVALMFLTAGTLPHAEAWVRSNRTRAFSRSLFFFSSFSFALSFPFRVETENGNSHRLLVSLSLSLFLPLSLPPPPLSPCRRPGSTSPRACSRRTAWPPRRATGHGTGSRRRRRPAPARESGPRRRRSRACWRGTARGRGSTCSRCTCTRPGASTSSR